MTSASPARQYPSCEKFFIKYFISIENVGAILTMPRAICHMTGRQAGVRRTVHYMKYESDSTIVYAMVFISGRAQNENLYYLSDTVSPLPGVSKRLVVAVLACDIFALPLFVSIKKFLISLLGNTTYRHSALFAQILEAHYSFFFLFRQPMHICKLRYKVSQMLEENHKTKKSREIKHLFALVYENSITR